MEPADNFVDIDGNVQDAQFCATIVFYKNCRANEVKKMPSEDFMQRIKNNIVASHHAILIDWVVEAADHLEFKSETIFLSVNCIDRYLAGHVVRSEMRQLLGAVCLMIAAKYEEVKTPTVVKFFEILPENTYTREELLQMESAVLNYLKFELTVPTAYCFLRRFIRAAKASTEVPPLQFEFLANYIGELSLLPYEMLIFAPSLVAASVIFLACFIIFPAKKPWNSNLRHYTGYQPSDLRICVNALHTILRNIGPSGLDGIRDRYNQHRHQYVAELSCSNSIPPEFFEDVRPPIIKVYTRRTKRNMSNMSEDQEKQD